MPIGQGRSQTSHSSGQNNPLPRAVWPVIYDINVRSGSLIDYFNSLSDEAKYSLRCLVPLDGWLAVIVYPGFKVKNAAQEKRSGITQLIREIAMKGHGYRVEGLNILAEIDLDLCGHF